MILTHWMRSPNSFVIKLKFLINRNFKLFLLAYIFYKHSMMLLLQWYRVKCFWSSNLFVTLTFGLFFCYWFLKIWFHSTLYLNMFPCVMYQWHQIANVSWVIQQQKIMKQCRRWQRTLGLEKMGLGQAEQHYTLSVNIFCIPLHRC